MPTVEEQVGALSEAARWTLTFQVVQILAPYGTISPEVIEPEIFKSLKARLEACADGDPCPDALDVAEQSHAVIGRFPDHEPDGPGFFAFAAVVSLVYLAETVTGDPAGPVNAAKRLVDALGFADEDYGHEMYSKCLAFLAGPTPQATIQLRQIVKDHVQHMQQTGEIGLI